LALSAVALARPALARGLLRECRPGQRHGGKSEKEEGSRRHGCHPAGSRGSCEEKTDPGGEFRPEEGTARERASGHVSNVSAPRQAAQSGRGAVLQHIPGVSPFV